MSRKKSKIRVKRKQTKKKRSKKGGTLTLSQKREKMLRLEELEKKMEELRLKKEKQEHKKQELQRNMSADRAKIPDFEERIRNLTLKAPVRPSRRSMLKRSPKPTKKSEERFEFKKESVQKVKRQPSALSQALQ